MEGWNTVPGKKIKKFFPTWGQNAQPGRIVPVFVWQHLYCQMFCPKELKKMIKRNIFVFTSLSQMQIAEGQRIRASQ